MRKVYYNHDGGVDDLVGLFLLLQMPDIDLVGVGVVNADCYVEPATSASQKIIQVFGQGKDIPVAMSNARPRNPFPSSWREHAFTIDAMPMLNQGITDPNKQLDQSADQHLSQILSESDQAIDLVFVGPLTDLATVLSQNPELSQKINGPYWMGGTFLANGNVQEPHHDGTAEWNAFWDPEAVKVVWDADIDIHMVGLESTNKVPLTNTIRQTWAQNHHIPGIDFLGQAYALVPPMSFIHTNSTYFLWDVLTVAYFADPSLAASQVLTSDVVVYGVSQGRTIISDHGRAIQLVYDVNHDRFFDYITNLARQAPYQGGQNGK